MEGIDFFDRTRLLIGAGGVERLKAARVLVFGLGGVGSFVVEALTRAGIGQLDVVDRDVVAVSNINRQLFALNSTIGAKKTDAARARLLDINPNLRLSTHFLSFDEQTAQSFDFSKFDYIVDAIDSKNSKVLIAKLAQQTATPLIACMGTGFKLDPTRLSLSDIYATKNDPLSKQMRKAYREAGITSLKVLYSPEQKTQAETPSFGENITTKKGENNTTNPTTNTTNTGENIATSSAANSAPITTKEKQQKTVASISFVPSVAGLLIAAEVVRQLLGI